VAARDTAAAPAGPPPVTTGFLGWMRRNLFSNVWNSLLTIASVYLLVVIVPPAFNWLFLDAVWSKAPPEACRAAHGACWAFIREKHRVIFFGRYPYDDQWRPLLGMIVLLTVVLLSCFRRFWKPWIGGVWVAGLAIFFLVMWGGDVPVNYRTVGIVGALVALAVGLTRPLSAGAARSLAYWIAALLAVLALGGGGIIHVLDAIIDELFGARDALSGFTADWFAIPTGLGFVPTTLWGGLPLTLLLSVVGIIVAFPLAILLALGRRSKMPVIRSVCIGYIELIRGVPLISLLFVAAFLLPLFLPHGFEISDLMRAQVAIIGFTAAYLAEVIRGGLQAIPRGQYEAADALGLAYPQKMGRIVLPQAIVLVIPPIVNSFISLFKDTSLVGIVSLTDLLLATRNLAIADINWRQFYVTGYVFCALVYFIFCFFMSQYSQYLERQFETGRQRRR
jgi:general L-amino acid transport system permease protein